MRRLQQHHEQCRVIRARRIGDQPFPGGIADFGQWAVEKRRRPPRVIIAGRADNAQRPAGHLAPQRFALRAGQTTHDGHVGGRADILGAQPSQSQPGDRRCPSVGQLDALVERQAIGCRGRGKALTAVASRSHDTPETARFLDDHGIDACTAIGSSLKFCLVAEGLADVYPRFSRTMEWDTAAGDAVLRAAGGETRTLDGEALVYGKRNQAHDADFANPNFIAGANFPCGVAVNATHIFWGNLDGDAIGRANLDGSGVNQSSCFIRRPSDSHSRRSSWRL